jgi:CxxC-x17-CxxC domain-containing protein
MELDFLPDGTNFNRDITYLAKTNYRKQEQIFGIKRRDRRQHMYVLGKSGTGKSVLLANMIVQNIWNGEGVCVVDPHGELVESIIATIPEHRIKDVIYFNPADTDYHIGFNVLEVDDPKYKHLVSSGLMGIFTKLWANVWSARMEYILNNAILALIDTPGSTLLGIPRMLVDKDYRQLIIGNLKDPVIKSFWVHEFEAWREQYRNEAIAPIQNKVGQFLSASIVRNVIGQSKSTIDLFDVMNSGKIFIVNVSKGRIGEDNASLLGGMIITKLQLAAMERVRIPEEQRKDFYLYVDEFQNFVTDSFASILSEARKYRLNLTLAHQYIAQLSTKDSDTVRDAVFGNVGTMIIFRVGAVDGDFLEKEFDPEFTPQDMVNLPNYKIYLKLMVDGVTSRPFSASTLPPFKIPEASNVYEKIVESSRRLYARPKEEVEREIYEWSGMMTGGPSGSGSLTGGTEGKFKTVCSLCGKETTVPFEPEPGRPVYCKECIAKIKTGELKPIKGTRSRSLEPQVQSFAALAGLGIEFAADEKSQHKPLFNRAPAHDIKSEYHAIEKEYKKVEEVKSNPVKQSFEKNNQTVKPQQSTVAVNIPAVVPVVNINNSQKQNSQPSNINVQENSNYKTKVAFAPREKKGPDHDGLQSILKEALGEALKAGAEFKKEVNKVEPAVVAPVVEKKTISLASLKKNENLQVKTEVKEASQERMSALQEAILKAKNSTVVREKTVVVENKSIEEKNNVIKKEEEKVEIKTESKITSEAIKPEIPNIVEENTQKDETPKVKEEPKEEIKKEEEKNLDTQPKKVREVPEEVLRGLLE